MAISFTCACGKALKARDDFAGKKTKCPQCGAILAIPAPDLSPDFDDGSGYALDEPVPPPRSAFDDESALRPAGSAYRSRPEAATSRVPSGTRPAVAARSRSESGANSLMEYAYLLLVFALIPLVVSLLGKEGRVDIEERIAETIEQATPEQAQKIRSQLAGGARSLDDVLNAMPDARLRGAHLGRDTTTHWVYAGIATAAFLLLTSLFFSVERVNPVSLFLIGLFTGTVGILFLLAVQFCSHLRGLPRGRYPGVIVILVLIVQFIGWSYDSAGDPNSNFFLSAFGFTFGVGLCEEFTKAIPLFFYFKNHAQMGWRGACLWGLASGIGFGVSEGIMYSSRMYNGIGGVDIYLVRFISCVALHAMWSASVGIAIARNVDAYEEVHDATSFVLFMLRIIAVPMVLHGFYDTLLKQDMNGRALVVALLSFGWLVMHIEMARSSHPHAGTGRRKYAY